MMTDPQHEVAQRATLCLDASPTILNRPPTTPHSAGWLTGACSRCLHPAQESRLGAQVPNEDKGHDMWLSSLLGAERERISMDNGELSL